MAVNTVTVGAGKLSIGATTTISNFEGQIISAKITPSASQDDAIAVLSGESVAGARTESFTLSGTLLQDLGAEGSTTEWLWMHRGEAQPFSFEPSTAAGKKFTGTLIVEAIEVGGDVNSKAQSDFEFTLVGAPTIVPVV